MGAGLCCIGSVPEISARELNVLLESSDPGDSFYIIDVRSAAEFSAGHIKGAVHCPLLSTGAFHERVAKLGLDTSKPVYTICLSAHRSIPATRQLRAKGIEARQLQGGMRAWRAAGFGEVR